MTLFIALNAIMLSFNLRLSEVARGIYSIAILISYALQCHIAIAIIWENHVSEKIRYSEKSGLYLYLLRTALTLITFVFAAAIPQLGLFISFFGSFCLSILGIAFPAIIELCVLWPDQLGPGRYIMWKDIAIILAAFACLVSGTYTVVHDIIESFEQ